MTEFDAQRARASVRGMQVLLHNPAVLLVLLLACAGTAWPRPSLPPAADIAAAVLVNEAAVAARAEGEVATVSDVPHETVAEMQRRPYLRAYEATSVGYTFKEDEHFLDFTLSMMVPLFHGFYPDQDLGREVREGARLRPYFAFTGRAGQYINSRHSQPVVGKRFNPLVSARYWWWEDGASPAARADTDRKSVV